MELRYPNYPPFRIDAERPLFVAISGAHAYGTTRPDSDLDVRAVRIPTLEWAAGMARDETGVEHRFGSVDVQTHNLYHFLSVLLHGNATFLENLYMEKLYEAPELDELIRLVEQHGLSTRFAGHFFGFIGSEILNHQRKKGIKHILYAYRVGLSGLHFFRTRKSEYSLVRLLETDMAREMAETSNLHAKELLDRYRSEEDMIFPDDPLMAKIDREINGIRGYFGRYEKTVGFVPSLAVRQSGLPAEPHYAPFNEWLLAKLIEDYDLRHSPAYMKV